MNFCDLRPIPGDAEEATRQQLNVILTHITRGDGVDAIKLQSELLDRSTLMKMTILQNFCTQKPFHSAGALSEVQQENFLKAVRSASLRTYLKVRSTMIRKHQRRPRSFHHPGDLQLHKSNRVLRNKPGRTSQDFASRVFDPWRFEWVVSRSIAVEPLLNYWVCVSVLAD